MRRALLAGALALVVAAPAAAQSGRAAATRSAATVGAGDGLSVILVTIGQGAAVWEKFGHNALWFHDPAQGIDVAYNWGIFDFAQPGFLRRFLTGDTRYWVEGYPGEALVDFYRESDRTVTLQRLNLTPAQARRALDYSRRNALEENKYYRYDYFRDNCSTRVRDVIDYAVGGTVRRATAGALTSRTYRSESVRLVDDLALTQLGITAALGQPADRRLSVWEGMFIPMTMRDALRLVRVPAAGGAVPLVAQERVVYESRTQRERGTVPALWLGYLAVGLFLALEFAAVAGLATRSRLVDAVFRFEVGLWALITGILGLALLLAWTSTRHVFWFRNENLLLFNPLSLYLAVVAPLSYWKPRFTRAAAWIAAVIAALGLVALVLKLVPGFSQQNLALILLLAPAHAAIAFGFWRRLRQVAA